MQYGKAHPAVSLPPPLQPLPRWPSLAVNDIASLIENWCVILICRQRWEVVMSNMERRAALESALSQLRLTHPAVPHLRNFQVTHMPFQANYVSCSPWPLTFLNNKTSDGHIRERLRRRWSPPHHVRSANWIRQKYADAHAWSPIASRCGLPNFRLRCTLYLNRVHNADCGPANPYRDSAARGLPETGFNSPCWQPGVKYIQNHPLPTLK